MAPKTKITAAHIEKQKALKTKKLRKRFIFGGSGTVLAFLAYLLFVPYKGGITFGVCKTFLELYVRYPDTIRHSTVQDFGDSVRIWFTRMDPFGEYRLEPIQCFFRQANMADKQKYGDIPFVVNKVTVNRQPVDQARVEHFNTGIQSIIAYPPDLTLPFPLPDSLESLQIDSMRFRKPIL